VVYDFPRSSDGYVEARRNQFPHANSVDFGGCMLGDEQTAKVAYCPECRKAEAAWRAVAKEERRSPSLADKDASGLTP